MKKKKFLALLLTGAMALARPHRLQQRHRDHRGEHWWGCVRRERRRRL